jgi:adenine-specific DNA methylase
MSKKEKYTKIQIEMLEKLKMAAEYIDNVRGDRHNVVKKDSVMIIYIDPYNSQTFCDLYKEMKSNKTHSID